MTPEAAAARSMRAAALSEKSFNENRRPRSASQAEDCRGRMRNVGGVQFGGPVVLKGKAGVDAAAKSNKQDPASSVLSVVSCSTSEAGASWSSRSSVSSSSSSSTARKRRLAQQGGWGAQGALYSMTVDAKTEDYQNSSQVSHAVRAPTEVSLSSEEILAAANRWRPGAKAAASIAEESVEFWRHRQGCPGSGANACAAVEDREASSAAANDDLLFHGIWPGRGGGELDEDAMTEKTYSSRHTSEGSSTYLRRKEAGLFWFS